MNDTNIPSTTIWDLPLYFVMGIVVIVYLIIYKIIPYLKERGVNDRRKNV
jgi:hypothetical protein